MQQKRLIYQNDQERGANNISKIDQNRSMGNFTIQDGGQNCGQKTGFSSEIFERYTFLKKFESLGRVFYN